MFVSLLAQLERAIPDLLMTYVYEKLEQSLERDVDRLWNELVTGTGLPQKGERIMTSLHF